MSQRPAVPSASRPTMHSPTTLMSDTPLWPDLDSPYALPSAQIEAFRRDGCIKLKRVLSPGTLAHFGREITRLTIELNTENRPLAERSTYDRAFLQVMNLWEHSALAARFVMGQRLARIAAELLQVPVTTSWAGRGATAEPGPAVAACCTCMAFAHRHNRSRLSGSRSA